MNIAVISSFNPVEFQDRLDATEGVRNTGVFSSSVHAIVRGFLNQGHQVTVVTSCHGPSDEVFIYKGDHLRIVLVQYRHGLMGLNVIPRMRRFIREHLNEFDVLHAHWTYIYAYAILPFVGKKPCFCSVRDWCPYLMTLPCPVSHKLNLWTNYFYFRRVMASRKLVKLANSHYTANCLTEWYGGEEKPIIIPNPVRDDIILDEHKCIPEHPVFVSVAYLLTDPRKNIGTLLQAFHLLRAEFPQAELKLVGSGQQEDFAHLQTSEDFFDGVSFCQRLPHHEVLDLMDRASVLVHPALEETFGNIFLEAAARCLPSIGGEKSGAVPHVLDQGKAGCLCDVTDVESLHQAMKKMLDSPEYAEELVRHSMQNIRQKYAQEVVCRQHIDVYKQSISL